MNKRKLIFAVLSLLMCLVLLISASFAWFSLSLAPEITGIDTYIGANGSLEIALLGDDTFLDPSQIRTGVGDSVVVQDATVSNLSWGNLMDLSDESYGLSQISMIPSRLNVYLSESGTAQVGNNMLAIPKYGMDGRFLEFVGNTVSAPYGENGFSYVTGIQHYGVRGIGTINGVSLQQSALDNARSMVKSYQSAAIAATKSAWSSNGGALLDIFCRRYYLGATDGYTDADLAVLRDTAVRMNNALSYIDLSLRQGVVGMLAATVTDEAEFRGLRGHVENTAIPLSMILDNVPGSIPGALKEGTAVIDAGRQGVQNVIAGCDALTNSDRYGGNYPWSLIREMVSLLITDSQTFMNNDRLNSSEAYSNMTRDNQMTLSPRSGVMASIADFCGNYNEFFDYTGRIDGSQQSVEVITSSTASKPVLAQVSATLEEQDAASGDATEQVMELEQVFGYAVDIAVRCNEKCDLLLQTEPDVRVEENLEFVSTQGGGSYMRFTSEQLSAEQIVLLMDALRVGFMDNQNHLVAMAKLNTSNYTQTEANVTAPLYLYEHTVCPDGSVSVGERLTDQTRIVGLYEDVATVLTVVVWLDGDHVDNSLASISGQSVTGALNLQFASSANLLPSNQNIKNNQ